MAKAMLLSSVAVFACWMALTPCIHGGHVEVPQQKKKSDPGVRLDIVGEQKKLGKQVADLKKETDKQMDKLKASIKTLDSEIGKIGGKEEMVKWNEGKWAELLEETKKLLQSIHMEVEQAELSRENGQKTLQKIKDVCQRELGKIKAEDEKLHKEHNAKLNELWAKAEAKYKESYAKQIEATRGEIQEKIAQFKREGGKVEKLEKLWAPGKDAKTKRNNEIVNLKSTLKSLIEKSATTDLEDGVCAEEKKQIEAARDLFHEKIAKLADREPFRQCLAEVHRLGNLMAWQELGKYTLPTPKELQQMKEKQDEREVQKAELNSLEKREKLEQVLKLLVKCLAIPLDEECQEQRQLAGQLSAEVAQNRKEMDGKPNGESAQRAVSVLFESVGKLFGLKDSDQKLSACVDEVISVYDQAEEEGRKKLVAEQLMLED